MSERIRRTFDDFTVGDTFASEPYTLTAESALAFAREYDPQPFHLDEAAAKASFFKSLVASGWQTAAIAMKLIVESGFMRETGVIGMGIDELRWLAPVRGGDTLRMEAEVIELRARPGSSRGTARIRTQVFNQDDVVVLSEIAIVSLPQK